jgi:hypothetical protein
MSQTQIWFFFGGCFFIGCCIGPLVALFALSRKWRQTPTKQTEIARRPEKTKGEMTEAFLMAKNHPIWDAVHEALDDEIVRVGNDLLEPSIDAREVDRLRGAQGGLVDFKAELLERMRDALIADEERTEVSRRANESAEGA